MRVFTYDEKLDLMRGLMWDYRFPPEHCLEVLEGTRERAGHYTESTLFRKLIESYRWHTVIKLLPLERINYLLTNDLIKSLRFESMKKSYGFIKEEIQRYLQAAG